MKTELVITDLTRMFRGMVCIAGYDKEHCCIRPILPPPGISESSLIQDGKPLIFPFSVVEFDLLDPRPQPPHTEDQFYDPASPRFIRRVNNWEKVLKWSLFDSVEQVFEQTVHDDLGFYVMDCQGKRSLGTIQPVWISKAIYAEGPEGAWDYRLQFRDSEDKFYRLKITDLTWHYYCDSLREKGEEPEDIAVEITKMLHKRKVYLRIGLSRGWKKFPDRCFLQINGIYTFPDYLEGRTFADFTPNVRFIRETEDEYQGYEVPL